MGKKKKKYPAHQIARKKQFLMTGNDLPPSPLPRQELNGRPLRGSQYGMKNECHARHEISRDKSRDMHTYIPATYIKADVE